ncbi:MAG: hypothetical protein Q4D04_06505 [Clostridia bacterium]|nr:hypothetical protein [Clostridia bacterium]
MDGIIGILIFWWIASLVIKSVKKAKQSQSARKTQNEPASNPAPQPRPAPKKSSVWEQVDMLNSMTDAVEADRKKPAGEGMSRPGSIAWTGTGGSFAAEGTGKSGSIAGTAPSPRQRRNDAPAFGRMVPESENPATGWTSRDMKSAVVMAEVLSKPVSMRPQTGMFQRRRCGV